MKRVWACLFLVLCYFLFGVIVSLDMALVVYIFGLYDQLSAFLKLIVIILGGTFIVGLFIAPLWPGIFLIHGVSEAICESRKGLRYTVFGIIMSVMGIICLFIGLQEIDIRLIIDIFYIIAGIAFIVMGKHIRKAIISLEPTALRDKEDGEKNIPEESIVLNDKEYHVECSKHGLTDIEKEEKVDKKSDGGETIYMIETDSGHGMCVSSSELSNYKKLQDNELSDYEKLLDKLKKGILTEKEKEEISKLSEESKKKLIRDFWNN